MGIAHGNNPPWSWYLNAVLTPNSSPGPALSSHLPVPLHSALEQLDTEEHHRFAEKLTFLHILS